MGRLWAALQFVGRSISVFLTFHILLCTVYLCWTWLHCSCWSLKIGAFSNNLTIDQFYLFLCLQHSHLYTHTLPPQLTHYFSGDLGTLSLGIPYHTCNATKIAREKLLFFFCCCFFQSKWILTDTCWPGNAPSLNKTNWTGLEVSRRSK